ncbi:hypothetical protein BDZ90DRAFT_280703 [Jaminaea rosea]|uniref:RING-CH-type domain-containing protein n=1 Tax=Jaminaea rosea TaxID=1569628 RepID=A0A316ULK3_9BASI|nr:hypothetical protein BDZ90DRAFT_280703 [Jaminaea rosea]PWN26166.1 hypothetical protein BDZ90DRAFT_280703 [Jaminaea rosea]
MSASDNIPGRELVRSSPTAQTRGRVVTVEDVKNRTCWICQLGDEDDDEERKMQMQSKAAWQRRNKQLDSHLRWLHSCHCFLIAHESCLLNWIHCMSKLDKKADNVKADRALRNVLGMAEVGIFAGSFAFACIKYGEYATRAWLGKAAAKALLDSGRGSMKLFFVPLVLLLSRIPCLPDDIELRLRYLQSAVPLCHDMAHVLSALAASANALTRDGGQWSERGQLFTVATSHAALGSRLVDVLRHLHPPTLAWSFALLPWYRAAYGNLRYRLTDWLLEPLVAQAKNRTGQQQTQTQPRPFNAVRVGGQPRPQLQERAQYFHFTPVGFGVRDDPDIDVDGQAQPPPLGLDGITDGPDPVAQAAAREAIRRGLLPPNPTILTHYYSPRSVLTLIRITLGTPFMAALVGAGLQGVAMSMSPGNWLERLLAVSAFRKGGTSVAGNCSTARVCGVPSLHWRNTVALGLYVFACDAVSLGYRYLRLKRRASLTVEDLPFSEGMVRDLVTKKVN